MVNFTPCKFYCNEFFRRGGGPPTLHPWVTTGLSNFSPAPQSFLKGLFLHTQWRMRKNSARARRGGRVYSLCFSVQSTNPSPVTLHLSLRTHTHTYSLSPGPPLPIHHRIPPQTLTAVPHVQPNLSLTSLPSLTSAQTWAFNNPTVQVCVSTPPSTLPLQNRQHTTASDPKSVNPAHNSSGTVSWS